MRSLAVALCLLVAAPAGGHEEVGVGHTTGRVACSDGSSDDFRCERVDLLAWMTVEAIGGGSLNDIWGWTDPDTGREYAIVGRHAGTSFVDITDPEAPVYLGELPAHDELVGTKSVESGVSACARMRLHDETDGCGESSTWRDIKVAGDHAYIVSEAADHGLQVFDLRILRGASGVQTFAETAHYDGFSTAHNLAVDEASGYLYVVGSDTYEGGLHILDVSTPSAPVFVTGFADDGYTHDAQCTVYAGPDPDAAGREVCFASNEDSLTILDVEDKGDIRILARLGYEGVAYTHQAWLSDDHAHLFVDDELDERQGGIRTRTLVVDVSDLSSPRVVATYSADSLSIDHNHYVVGRHLFQSHYSSGLRVLDVSRPRHPLEVGRFDTYPADDEPAFRGSWSNYPFFASGTVAVSDTKEGLFLLQPRMHPDPGSPVDLQLQLDGATPTATEGESLRRDLRLINDGDAAQDVSLQVVHGEGLRLTGPSDCERRSFASVCRFDSLAAGEERALMLSFAADAAGEHEVAYRLASAGAESDTRDNSSSETVRIQSAEQSAPPPSGGSSGGGGPLGGSLLGLLSLCLSRRTTRRR